MREGGVFARQRRWRGRANGRFAAGCLVGVCLLLAQSGGARAQDSGAEPAPPRPTLPEATMELLYSSNDALCRPLRQLYDDLYEHHYDDVVLWEKTHAEKFRAIGLLEPPEVAGEAPVDDVWLASHAIYHVDLAGDRRRRMVYILHYSQSYQMGEMWVLKPGAAWQTRPTPERSPRPLSRHQIPLPVLVDYSVVPYREALGLVPGDYRMFLFDKIAGQERLSRPHTKRYHCEINTSSGPIILRRFSGKYYVISRDEGARAAIVYRLNSRMKRVDVCYMARRHIVRLVREKWHTGECP